MKKIVALLILGITFLTGCSNNGNTQTSSSSTLESTSSSSTSSAKSYGNLTPERRKNTFSSSSESSNSSTNNTKTAVEVTKEQKDLLVVFTQQDLEDYGYEYKFKGWDEWDVVTQDTDTIKRYIITTEDDKLGRIKSVYEWDGNKDSGATPIYLLVGGTEHLNKLRE